MSSSKVRIHLQANDSLRVAVQQYIRNKRQLSLDDSQDFAQVLDELKHRYEDAALIIADRNADLSEVTDFAEQFPEMFVVGIFPEFKPPSNVSQHPHINEAISNVSPETGTIVESVMSRLAPASSQSQVINKTDEDRMSRLTEREKKILSLTALGLSINETAAQLNRAPGTIARHRANIMHKLEVHDRVALARFAIRVGLVSND